MTNSHSPSSAATEHEPVGYFCFVPAPKDDGEPIRIRAWTTSKERAESISNVIGRTLEPLYRAPKQPQLLPRRCDECGQDVYGFGNCPCGHDGNQSTTPAQAPCNCGIMCQDLGKEAGCRYMQPTRRELRKLVDVVYKHAADSVPMTLTADKLIDEVFGPDAAQPPAAPVETDIVAELVEALKYVAEFPVNNSQRQHAQQTLGRLASRLSRSSAVNVCDCGTMCQDLGKEAGCRYMQPARRQLRRLVDLVHLHAADCVPTTKTADKLIDEIFGPDIPDEPQTPGMRNALEMIASESTQFDWPEGATADEALNHVAVQMRQIARAALSLTRPELLRDGGGK